MQIVQLTTPHKYYVLVLGQLHWLPVRRRVKFKLACLVRQALCGQMPIYLADMTLTSSPKATDDPFGLPLITCAWYHVRTTALATEALVLSAHKFGTVCGGLRTLDISYKHFKALLKIYMFRRGHGAL